MNFASFSRRGTHVKIIKHLRLLPASDGRRLETKPDASWGKQKVEITSTKDSFKQERMASLVLPDHEYQLRGLCRCGVMREGGWPSQSANNGTWTTRMSQFQLPTALNHPFSLPYSQVGTNRYRRWSLHLVIPRVAVNSRSPPWLRPPPRAVRRR